MKATSRITLKAFLLSLAEQDKLPPEWQPQLAQFDWNSDAGLATVHKWASEHLNPSYDRWCEALEEPLVQRSKADAPDPDLGQENQQTQREYSNTLMELSNDLMIKTAKEISQNPSAWRKLCDRLFRGGAKG